MHNIKRCCLMMVLTAVFGFTCGCGSDEALPQSRTAAPVKGDPPKRTFEYRVLYVAPPGGVTAGCSKAWYNGVMDKAQKLWTDSVDGGNKDKKCNVEFKVVNLGDVRPGNDFYHNFHELDSWDKIDLAFNQLPGVKSWDPNVIVCQRVLDRHAAAVANRPNGTMGIAIEYEALYLGNDGLWAHEIGHNAGLPDIESESSTYPTKVNHYYINIMMHDPDPFHRHVVTESEHRTMMNP